MTWRNRAKCKNCGDIIESKHQHDFVTCTCFEEGKKRTSEYAEKHHCTGYVRNEYLNLDMPEIDHKSLYEDPKYKQLCKDWGRGFFLDGGKGVMVEGKRLGTRCGGNFSDMEWMTGGEDDSNS